LFISKIISSLRKKAAPHAKLSNYVIPSDKKRADVVMDIRVRNFNF